MSAAERIDGIVVAGAGPVGLITALILARAGIPVLVVDAARDILQLPRAIVYHPPSVAVLDRLGLLDEMMAAGLIKHDYQWRTPAGEILAAIDSSVLQPDDTPYPYNLHLGQHRLAAIVLQALLREPSAELRWEHRVIAVAQDDDAVDITLETPDGRLDCRAPFLVGADGASSGVRGALGLDFTGTTWPEWFVASDIRFPLTDHGFADASFVLDPVHWAVIPKISHDQLWRLTYGEPPEVPREQLRNRFAAKMRALLPGGAAVEPEAFSPYRVHTRCIDRFRIGRVVLAGDAAHAVNPIGGLGLTGGILDADALGGALVAAWRDRRHDAALDHYAAERRRIFCEVVAPTADENKRRLMETDPEQRRVDRARLRHLQDDPGAARQMLLATRRLVGTPYREDA